jgi:carboxymethylenebutenolidase
LAIVTPIPDTEVTMRAVLPILLLLSTPALAAPSSDTTATTMGKDVLPPSETTARARLESSPRHGEFVSVPRAGSMPIQTWIVYPERADKAGVVILIPEIYGLSDWLRGVADQVAKEGFIAVAPDFLSGLGPGGGGTDSVKSRDDVVKLIRGITPEQARANVDAARAYAAALPSSNGKVATMGFCWGGGHSFAYATTSPPPQAAVVFYGSAPDSARLVTLGAPVLGLYGGDDARINSGIAPAQEILRKARKSTYEPHVFAGAGHGFLRQQEDREGANRAATEQAWPMVVKFLSARLR